MSSFGIQSLLQLDLFLKREKKKIIPFQKKVSDSTLSRVINLMFCEPLREILYYISEIAIKKGYGKIELSKLGKVRVGVIDGSSFGNIFASVISLVGKIDMPIDLEVYETKGKELPSSKVVIERIEKRFGKGFFDFLVGDSIYAYREFFSFCLESLSCHGVVKMKNNEEREKKLEVIETAKQIFERHPEGDKEGYVEYKKGIDLSRMESYEIWATSEIYWEGLKYPLRVAFIKEKKIKGKKKGEEESYYVITTDQSLSPITLRELAIARWHIENNTFRALNEQCHSKHGYVRGRGMSALLLIIFIAFILLQVFKKRLEKERERSKVFTKKEKRISFRELRQLFWESLGRRIDTS